MLAVPAVCAFKMEHTVGQILLALFDQLWANRWIDKRLFRVKCMNCCILITKPQWCYWGQYQLIFGWDWCASGAKGCVKYSLTTHSVASIWVVQTGFCPLFTFVEQFELMDVKSSQVYLIKPLWKLHRQCNRPQEGWVSLKTNEKGHCFVGVGTQTSC